MSAVGVATAKRFFNSDFANSDGVISAEDHETEVKITPLQRWLIVATCVVVALVGGFWIQHDRNWNPFQFGADDRPVAH